MERRKSRRFRSLIWALACCATLNAGQLVTISQSTETIKRADGTNAYGQITINWQAFTNGAVYVAAGFKAVTVSNGVITPELQLYDNATSIPAGTSYRVQYDLDDGTKRTTYWIVPNSASTVISAIETVTVPSPSLAIALSQIQGGGADTGDVPCWNGSNWIPCDGSVTGNSLNSADYIWSYTNGSGISGDLSAAGAGKVLTFTVCPRGIAATGYIYISGGTGTAEVALIASSTCQVGGGSAGTATVTTANTHTGAWVAATSNAGVQEAIFAAGTSENVIYMPAGTLTWRARVTVPADSAAYRRFKILGAGSAVTEIVVDPAFPLSHPGVFVSTAEPGPIFEGFTMSFTQPDSLTYGAYTQWPPAFYLVNSPRFEVRDVLVNRAWAGINMTGNSGGSIIDGFRISPFSYAIDIDGSLDSVRISNLHVWPFGLTANQQTTWFDHNNPIYGIRSGRGDNIIISDSFFIGVSQCMWFRNIADAFDTFASITNTDCDNSTFRVEAGHITFTGGVLSGFTPNVNAVLHLGGDLIIANSWFIGTATGPMVSVVIDGASTIPANLQLLGNMFDSYGAVVDAPIVKVSSTNVGLSATAIIADNSFERVPDTAYTTPIIWVANTTGSARATVTGNRTRDKGTGAGTFIQVDANDHHYIWGNSFVGWASSYPATKTGAVYQDAGTSYLPYSVTLEGFLKLGSVTFTALSALSVTDGTSIYCSDCTIANPCAGSGTGAFAKRINGAWVCN